MSRKRSANAVTIHDVAQLAEVSPATVSKVINDVPYVSEETRQRVLAAIDKLNYRPNVIARSLRKSHTATIGLITDDLEGVFTMAMMRSIEEVASTQGFSVFLCNSYGEMSRERAHLEVLLAKQVSGVILMSGYKVRERGAPALELGRVPVVYLYQYTRDVDVPCIIPDDLGGGALGTRHLLDLGRRRIGFINGPLHFEASQQRLIGYQQALRNHGIPFDPALVRTGKWNEQSGYELAHELMALPQPPDAIFCASDSLAAGALDALHELGLRIPQDVAVVGFDNRYFSGYQRPPLTTVALPLYEMGSLAGELLLKAIQGEPPHRVIHRVPCTLVKRLSCGAPPD
ncbi:MAG: LacI family DNA-binding transcriptional regulator [Anaerolineae bacterium]|nr:LacI family DNA-binding transcriptional regulator [Anaerolineae bacterium]